MFNFSTDNKSLILGTALWGWGVSKAEAFNLIDSFLEQGGKFIDTATNYPINKREADFGLAINWIESWIKENPNSNLSVIAKVGSLDNSGAPNSNLTPEKLIADVDALMERFGNMLGCVSVHWDNRGDTTEDQLAIEKTADSLNNLRNQGIEIGLSGIKKPELYHNALPELSEQWIIQVKENLTTSNARSAYTKYFPKARYLAYGINLGGMSSIPAKKDSSSTLRAITHSKALIDHVSDLINSEHNFKPCPRTLNELALLSTYMNAALSGVIIGPRTVEQLSDTLTYWKKLKSLKKDEIDINFIKQLKDYSQ
ncbi:aldo/keto reductase [Pseudomonas sp. YeP6b]|uniref:aldo/keto reductase n=1 Tax=Pseudomonas sp. YeP6b TaxID=2861775 RepID=UPI0021D9183C|nr:aldo/keto reductase [Pseudomonas sp. YeP6b]UXZ21250.1 aldo/keto reductase [Pseudomonas sp. YeP6b]